MRLPCAERERFLPADCVTARRNEARCIGAGESRGDYALACFIFRILRRPQVGKAVAFLASDAASFINATELFVDGGMAQI
ncbi:SDR family oxidoreductase [Enterobacter kobei]|uniref:SDR family oxidoreductase n=1 Tax=Enterobacter kobei TaxID=208224 RepID=UPI0022E23309|nr:SDR family oxidoreductase [Enterobacter kobei]